MPWGTCDYGRHEVASDSFGVEQALLVALRELKEQFTEDRRWGGGPPSSTASGTTARRRPARSAGTSARVRLVEERVEEPPPPAREEGPGPLAWLFNYRGKH